MSSSSRKPPARKPADQAEQERQRARQVRRPVVTVVRPAVPGTVHRPELKAADRKHEAHTSVARAVAVAEESERAERSPSAPKAKPEHNPLHLAARAHGAKTARGGSRASAAIRKKRSNRRSISFGRKSRFRVRHLVQAGLVVGCMSWGIYQVVGSALVPPDVPSTGASAVAQTGQTLDAAYPGLPAEVAAVVKSVVATQRITDTNGDVQNGFAGSGVIVNDRQILTAGHNVEDGKGLACARTRVLATGMLARASASEDEVTYASVEYGKGDDIAVLEVAAGANFKDLPDVRLAPHAPQAGETVYFVNYQPAADGTARNPFAADAAHAEPAIFSATVLGTSGQHFAVAAGGGTSFGRGIADVMLRKGASGGAILNGRGELVGLSVASESLAANRSAASILREYQVNLPERSYQVAYMQQVDQALVSRLQTGMVSCAGI